MPSGKTILTMVLVTMGTMWLMNQAASMNPTVRRLVKGELLTVAASNGATIAV